MRRFKDIVAERLEQLGKTALTAATGTQLEPYTLQRVVKRNQVPSVERAAEICEALGLEFYIGPPRESGIPQAGPQEAAAEAGDGPPWKEIVEKLNLLEQRLDGQPVTAVQAMPGMRAVGVVRLKAAAGHGSPDTGATPAGVTWFSEEWLQQRKLDPVLCTVMRVYGDSMEPTLPDQSSILIDRSQRDLLDGKIFVSRIKDELVVKRAKLDRGRWLLISDNPVWPPIEPHPTRTEIYGAVRWTSRTFW